MRKIIVMIMKRRAREHSKSRDRRLQSLMINVIKNDRSYRELDRYR